jgi:predicted helicase
MGNPPYSVSSSNKGEWIQNLLADYKKDLNEKNIQPLSDDYIKFIRYGQHYIEKNGEGILAYISNNSFIDGLIHRQMRKYLLETFDKMYILDLHGNNKKKETAPDGGKDENVFDIMQGVSINIFVKLKNEATK